MSQRQKNQLRAVCSEEVRLQRDFETVNRLLGADVLRQPIPHAVPSHEQCALMLLDVQITVITTPLN